MINHGRISPSKVALKDRVHLMYALILFNTVSKIGENFEILSLQNYFDIRSSLYQFNDADRMYSTFYNTIFDTLKSKARAIIWEMKALKSAFSAIFSSQPIEHLLEQYCNCLLKILLIWTRLKFCHLQDPKNPLVHQSILLKIW